MQMRQRDVAALMQNTQLADAKAENDALRDCCRWSSSVAHQQSVSQCVKPPPAWIMQPPDWQTPLNRIISPSEG